MSSNKKPVKNDYISLKMFFLFNSISRYPASIYLFKFNNRNVRKRCEIRSKLTIKTPLRSYVIYVFNILKKNETLYQTDKGFIC